MATHIRAEVTTTSRLGDRRECSAPEQQEQEPYRLHTGLRHPCPYQEPQQLTALAQRPATAGDARAGSGAQGGPQLERVVSVLLRELSETRRERNVKDAQLSACKDEYLSLLRSSVPRKGDRRDPPAGSIRAFRPPGVAPPPPPLAKPQLHRKAAAGVGSRQQGRGSAELGSDGRLMPSQPGSIASQEQQQQQQQQAEALASMLLDNADLRRQLAALQDQCQQLKAQVSAANSTAGQRPASPGMVRATLTVSSPGRTQQCDLAAAVFQPPTADVDELQQQLNKLQRDNLKLSSKAKAAEAELTNKAITAKRWEEACEAQAAQIAAFKVDLEQERRHHAELERSIARAGDECDARADDVTALLSQLKHAEQAALAAQGEAAALRSQLLQVEALLAAKHEEAQQMKQTLNTTIARLQASELVRHEVEQEKGILATANERLQCDLADAQQRCDSEALELKAAVATLQQRLSAEEQRSAVLQAQLQLVEQQSRDTERILSGQLRTAQEERNACLAAATRADALLTKLGTHAWQVKGGTQ